ncbi:MAG: hypothetical protein RIN56_14530 [Sporomusaceae bacterium]|nr:hypothetical protein [Sporomusaceae bacterium]
MKKLLGLVAVALLLSFATVSVAWAGPAQNHDQHKRQGKEEQRKTAKQPTGVKRHKAPGKESVKAPPAHNRTQIKQNRQDRHPAKISGRTPANHSRDQVKHHNRQPQGPDRIGAKRPDGNNRQLTRNNDRHPAKNRDKINPPANHGRHDIHRYHSRLQHWPTGDEWPRHFRDWSWFSSHHVRSLGACYADDRRDRALYIHFEPQDSDYFYLLESRYGHPAYRERHRRYGHDGWCHYWFRGDNVIAFFIGDNGYSQAFVWRRDEVENRSLAFGILTPDLQIVYSSYGADLPPDLAAGYTREILWATVDDES